MRFADPRKSYQTDAERAQVENEDESITPVLDKLIKSEKRADNHTKERKKWLIMWLVFGAVIGFMFWRVEQVVNQAETRGAIVDYILCVRSNEARLGIREFLAEDLNADPEIINKANERFQEKECPPLPAGVSKEELEGSGNSDDPGDDPGEGLDD